MRYDRTVQVCQFTVQYSVQDWVDCISRNMYKSICKIYSCADIVILNVFFYFRYICILYKHYQNYFKRNFFICFVLVITPSSRVMKSCIMSLHFFPSLLMTFSRYPLSFILYPVSYILYPISCILYPYHVSCILYPVSSILYPVSCILYPVSCIMYPVICTLCAIYCILYHTHKPCTHSCMPSPLAPDPIRVQSWVCCLY